MDRRSVLKASAVMGLAALGSSAHESLGASGKELKFDNRSLYNASGEFQVEKGKDAILALCKYHGYPVFPGMRERLWVSDYSVGHFTEVGLAACSFINNVEDKYMLMDLFLLPGQMLPEHWHLEAEGNPAKREGWLVRWGVSYIVGIGEPNLGAEVKVPASHWNGKVETQHVVRATPGMFVPLAKPGSKHWQLAGPQGAIITEVANVHTDSAVRHSDPKMNEYFLSLGKKAK